jgi:membrane-associated phospholipid phosphatase
MARRRRVFLPILLLNIVMIASVMSEGAHYFVDMLSGVFVALAAIVITRRVLGWCHRAPARTPLVAWGRVECAISRAFGGESRLHWATSHPILIVAEKNDQK